MRRPPGIPPSCSVAAGAGCGRGRHAACPARGGHHARPHRRDLYRSPQWRSPATEPSLGSSSDWRDCGGPLPRPARSTATGRSRRCGGLFGHAPMSSRRSRCENDWNRNSVVLDSRTFRCTSSAARRASSALPSTGSPVALSRRRSWRRRQSPVLPAGADRRRALPRRGHRQFGAGGTGRRTRSTGRLRAPGRSRRAPALRAGGSDRGGQGVLRDRTTPPFPPRDGPDARGGAHLGAAERRWILARRLLHGLPQFRCRRTPDHRLVCREPRLSRRPTPRGR